MLGRRFEIRGPVIEGDERGRTIGFPTANIPVPKHMAWPADAVYAGWYIRPDGTRHMAAINIGRRPTFYEHAEQSLLEAHVLDFDGDLYGEQARVQFECSCAASSASTASTPWQPSSSRTSHASPLTISAASGPPRAPHGRALGTGLGKRIRRGCTMWHG